MTKRRLLALLALAAAIAAAALAAGCGSGSKDAKNGLDDALGYFPKDSLVVVAIKTDLSDDQYKQLNALAEKFPFAGTIKDQFKNGIKNDSGGKFDFDKDLKPALGNDIVVGVPSGGPQGGHQDVIAAWRVNGDGAKKLLTGDRKVGESEGAAIYEDTSASDDPPSYRALKGDTLLFAGTRPLLDAALKTRNSGDRLTQADFESGLGGLSKDALVRVEGDGQAILASDPMSANARKVPWLGALRTFSATAGTVSDGIAVDFRAKTEGALKPADLPLASGAASPPVVKRDGQVNTALRGPAEFASFLEQVGLTDPKGAARKAEKEKALGVDIDRDLIGQLGDNSAASFGLDHDFAMRVDLKDPEAFNKTLATVVKNLPKVPPPPGHPPVKVSPGPGGLYELEKSGYPTKRYFGVVGDKFVMASDPERAREFAALPASPVPGLHGAFALAADPKSIADAIIAKRGGVAAGLFGGAISGPLKDLSGWADAEPSGITGHFKLTIR